METSRTSVSPLNIYTAIGANRRRTGILMVVFVLFIGVMVELMGMALGLPLLPASIVAAVAAGLALVVAWWVYRASDSLVLAISGARQVDRRDYLELFRTVENLCIGTGLPMPLVYIIDDTAPNAFATGRDPQHASIAVTKGLLEKLEKQELEGVIAHELSHIGNYDTRLMVVAAVLVGFTALLVDLFLRYTWYGAGRRPRYRGRGEGAGGAILLALAIIAIILAPIVAKLIQFAVSRQREYLADASSALLTRYPEGLARALEKIAGDSEPLEVATKGTAHLYIANPLKGQDSFLNNLFSTHPPIKDRLARLRAMTGEARS